MLNHLGIAGHGGKGIHARDKIARPAIQKAKPDHVGPEKFPEGPESEIGPAGAAPAGLALPDKNGAHHLDFAEHLVNIFVAVMEQVGAQRHHPALQHQFFMGIAFPFARGLAPEPHFAVGIPVAVPDPASAELRQAWKTISRRQRRDLVAVKRGDDFVAQFVRNHLVGVNRQQPRLGGVV